LIALLLQHIWQAHSRAPILVAVSTLNTASRRALEKNGFVLVAEQMIDAEPGDEPTTPRSLELTGTGTLLAAGLLVGIGVRMGNGCTSGHGVCGLSRFSPRSLANVLAFMGAGVIAVYVVKHLL